MPGGTTDARRAIGRGALITQSMSAIQPAPTGKGMRWTGRILGGMAAAMLLLDGVMKIVKPELVVKATTQLGFPESCISGIGIALVVCVIVYIIPRTAVLGAMLITGYLGGAVATHVRAGNGWFEILMPVIFGVFVWAGLFLRDARLRALVPWQSQPSV
jgi:hypothetical protein